MNNIDQRIQHAKMMGCEHGGVVMHEDTVRQALLDIQKETAREMVHSMHTRIGAVVLGIIPKEEFNGEIMLHAYKQITGEDY